jgi:chromosome segregation ATPase
MQTDISALKSNVSTQGNTISTLSTDVSTLKTDVSKDKTDISALKSNVAEKQDKTDEALTTKTKTIVSAINEVNTLAQNLDNELGNENMVTEQAQSVRGAIAEINYWKGTAKQDIEFVSGEIEALRGSISSVSSSVSKLTTRLSELEKDSGASNAELKGLTTGEALDYLITKINDLHELLK